MFRTEIPLTPLPHQLPPAARVLTLGSCFSDSIGARLTEFKVATLVNPFGTVFNPLSACKLLRAAAGEDMDWQQHLVEARGRWQSYDLHAEIGADSPVELLQHVQQLAREVGVFLATADVVVLTLGSAYAYRLRETGELVSNCHKVPAEKFDKELLTADEIIAAVAETHAYLRRINPKLRFVLTVSPVRHLKDTLVLNSASKAMLRVACHYLSELLPDVTYFPAYELLVDDLRDYRFYATDMLHLSESAEDYVWEKFTRTYFDAAFGRFKKDWEGIRQNLGHRPLYPAAPEHRAFLESTLERLRKLDGTADVRVELLHVERELANLPAPKSRVLPEEAHDDGEERIDIGSFDDQAALDEALPVASIPIAAAATAVPKKQSGSKSVREREPGKAAPAKSQLTSQASLLRPGAGLLIEDAEEAELEEIDAEEASVSADSAYDHAYSPTTTALTDEAEADEADAEDTNDADDSEEANPEETLEEAAGRKKRRSRGGAKRTKRKHARLAAEQAAGEGQPEDSVVATAPAPLPDAPLAAEAEAVEADEEPASDVVYVTEAELRQSRPRPEAAAPAATPVAAVPAGPAGAGVTEEAEPEQTEPDTAETTAETRRSRNRRGSKREQAPRYGGRPGRPPLYADGAEAAAPADAQAETPAAVTAAAVEPVTPAPAQETEATPITPDTNAVPVAEVSSDAKVKSKRAARKKPSRAKVFSKALTAEPVATPETVAVADTTSAAPAPAEPVSDEPAAAKAAPPKSVRRKPTAKAKASATKAATPEEPITAVATSELPTPVEAALEPAKAPAKQRTAAKPKNVAAKTAKMEETGAAAEKAAVEPAVDDAPVGEVKKATGTKTTPQKASKTKPKAATKKAPATAVAAKATPATEAAAAAAPVKPPAKARAKAAIKPGKKAEPEVPES